MCKIEWLVARISKPYLSHYLNISTVWYSTAVVVWSWDAKASQSNQNVILVVHSGRFSRAGIIFRQQRWRVFCSSNTYYYSMMKMSSSPCIVKSACGNCSNERKIENWFYFRLYGVWWKTARAEEERNYKSYGFGIRLVDN